MALSGERNWCWGSLRPWQILHSRLAEKGGRGQELDVCELIDETLGAAADLRNGEEDKEPHFYEAYFLDDDGEFWRHGGVMEARIREWLAMREAQEDEEATEANEEDENHQEKEAIVLNKCCATRSTIATRSWPPEKEEYPQEGNDDDGNKEDEEEVDPVIAGAAKYLAAQPNIEASSEEKASDLCAVCLEKLLPHEPLYLLPCGHNFHSVCLSLWRLERPHACCPCCRAAVPANVSPQLPNIETFPDLAPPVIEAPQGEGDIMSLLAEMEAALDRFGLLS